MAKGRGKKKTKNIYKYLIGASVIYTSVLVALVFFHVKKPKTQKTTVRIESPTEMPSKRMTWPEGHRVYGIDVSRYQTHIDWSKVKKQDISFVFIKATDGVVKKDPFFNKNWQGAEKAGLHRGAYHFFYPKKDPKEQANNFLSTYKPQKGDLPPVLDVELDQKVPAHVLRKKVKIWIDIVKEKTGIHPIIYTNYKFYTDYLENHFDEHYLWIAHYKTNKLAVKQDKKLSFWQFTDKGKIEGIKGNVDCNVFYGTIEDLTNLCL